MGTVTEEVEGDPGGNFNNAGSLNQGDYIRNWEEGLDVKGRKTIRARIKRW